MSLKHFASEDNRIELSSSLLDFAAWIVVINFAFYIILWLLAWRVGAIPESGDFFGNHGPWRRSCFLSSFLSSVEGYGSIDLFCTFTQILLPLIMFSIIPLFVITLIGFFIRPSWKGILLLIVTFALGYVTLQHIVLID
ncbi:MAG: hypothetical protein WC911_06170 [Thermoleophilia bacterium]